MIIIRFKVATIGIVLTVEGVKGDGDGSSFVPEGYVLRWEDDFEGTEINTTNWVVASLRDPVSGDHLGTGDHLLGYQYAGYITEEDTYAEGGSLVLRNQKRSYQGTSPQGEFDYTSSWVMSMHRVHFNKGYVEIRAQFPTGDKGRGGMHENEPPFTLYLSYKKISQRNPHNPLKIIKKLVRQSFFSNKILQKENIG